VPAIPSPANHGRSHHRRSDDDRGRHRRNYDWRTRYDYRSPPAPTVHVAEPARPAAALDQDHVGCCLWRRNRCGRGRLNGGQGSERKRHGESCSRQKLLAHGSDTLGCFITPTRIRATKWHHRGERCHSPGGSAFLYPQTAATAPELFYSASAFLTARKSRQAKRFSSGLRSR
jgi:hypothetical protein